MDFITWWFTQHCYWALFLTPWFSFIYGIYAGYSAWWLILCLHPTFLKILSAILKAATKERKP